MVKIISSEHKQFLFLRTYLLIVSGKTTDYWLPIFLQGGRSLEPCILLSVGCDMTKLIFAYRIFRKRLRRSRGSGPYPTASYQAHTYISSIIFSKTVIYRQIRVNHKPFKPIIVTAICVIGINSVYFRNVYLYYPQFFIYWFCP